MFPGMGGRGGGINSRQLNAMMKQMGITLDEIDNVEEVIIRTPTKEYVFKDAEVSVMTAQGQKTWQVVGEPTITDKRAAGAAAPQAPPMPKALFSEDDVKLVAEQAGVPADKARKALEAARGEVAEAIVRLMDEK